MTMAKSQVTANETLSLYPNIRVSECKCLMQKMIISNTSYYLIMSTHSQIYYWLHFNNIVSTVCEHYEIARNMLTLRTIHHTMLSCVLQITVALSKASRLPDISHEIDIFREYILKKIYNCSNGECVSASRPI